MIKILKDIFKKIIKLWNIYGGIILSTFVAWLNNFSRDNMDNITSYLVMTLTFISVLTFFKLVLFKKKSDGIIDSASLNQSSIKAMKTAIDPLKNGEEIGKTILKTEKILERLGKKIMKWFLKNKGAIITLIGGVITGLEFAFNWLGQYLPSQIGFNIVAVIEIVLTTVLGCLTSGFGSVEFKEKVAMIKDQLNGDKTDLTYIKDEKYLKKQIESYEKLVLKAKKDISSLEKSNSKVIEEYDRNIRLHVAQDENVKKEYDTYLKKLQEAKLKLSSREEALKTYKTRLSEIENVISKTTEN